MMCVLQRLQYSHYTNKSIRNKSPWCQTRQNNQHLMAILISNIPHRTAEKTENNDQQRRPHDMFTSYLKKKCLRFSEKRVFDIEFLFLFLLERPHSVCL